MDPHDEYLMNLSESVRVWYQVYYEQKKKRQLGKSGASGANNGYDDENHDYILREKNEVFHGRYELREKIGKGSFGQVIRAYDKTTGEEVAIKMIKSKKPFMLQAKTEIELLQFLNRHDPKDQMFVVRLLDLFLHRGHQVS
jgi:dual specificity tyrosine-phosphorylation-regulated kinase 1